MLNFLKMLMVEKINLIYNCKYMKEKNQISNLPTPSAGGFLFILHK